jgi:hypothetical protein
MAMFTPNAFPNAQPDDWGMYRRDQRPVASHPDSIAPIDPDTRQLNELYDNAIEAGVDPDFLGGTPAEQTLAQPVDFVSRSEIGSIQVPWNADTAAAERADDKDSAGGYHRPN